MNSVIVTKSNTNIMRGLAILFVFASHITAKVLPLSLARLFTPFGGIGVALFLFLSGYGLTVRYKDSLKGYWYNRFIGTFLPYLLVWLVTVWMRTYESIEMFVADFFAMTPLTTYFWYLGYLLIWYVCFFLANRFVKNLALRYSFYAVISLLILLFGKELWAEQAFIFPLGCLLAEDIDISKKANEVLCKRAIVIACVLAVVGVGCLAIKQLPIVRNAPQIIYSVLQMFIKTPLALSVILIFGKIRWGLLNKALMTVGNLSYELYLIHSVTIAVFDLSFINKIIAIPLFIVITIVLSLALSWLTKTIRKTLKNRKVGI